MCVTFFQVVLVGCLLDTEIWFDQISPCVHLFHNFVPPFSQNPSTAKKHQFCIQKVNNFTTFHCHFKNIPSLRVRLKSPISQIFTKFSLFFQWFFLYYNTFRKLNNFYTFFACCEVKLRKKLIWGLYFEK